MVQFVSWLEENDVPCKTEVQELLHAFHREKIDTAKEEILIRLYEALESAEMQKIRQLIDEVRVQLMIEIPEFQSLTYTQNRNDGLKVKNPSPSTIDPSSLKSSYTKQVSTCKTSEDFHILFQLNGIPKDKWQSSSWLATNNFSSLVRAITRRFGRWTVFLKFMGISKSTFAEQIRDKNPEQLLALFAQKGIHGDMWRSSGWLETNGFSGLSKEIFRHFGKWDNFLNFMGKEKWSVLIKNKSYVELIQIFRENRISDDGWRSSAWLQENEFMSLYRALFTRFGSWDAFIGFMEEQKIESEFETLEKLNAEEAIALIGHDPAKLKLYIQYAHPELSEAETNELVCRSFKGLVTGPNQTKEEQYLRWEASLPFVQVGTEIPETTAENTLTIKGVAPNAECVYVAGTWNRRVKTEPNGAFTVVIPLKIGEENVIRILGLRHEQKSRSVQETFVLRQEGEPDDVAALLELLSQLRGNLLQEIQKDPGRMEFFISCTEKILIKKFARSFPEGETYVQTLMDETKSKIIRRVLHSVLKNFRTIENLRLPNVKDGSLMFFQKYCVYEIRKSMKGRSTGINLANDPGLGKTRTILAALSDEEAVIFTPNPVVSAWDEEAGVVLKEPDLLVLRDVPHKQRKELLRNASHLRLVTNVQFLQNPDDAERFQLLSSDDTVVVHDEAHSRANEESLQSRGAKKLKHKFQINVTATLAHTPKTLRRMLHTLEPEDPRFHDDKAFMQAFPGDDPQALKALKLLVDKYTIRFRKEDVMEEVDPNVLLSQQLHRLPRKNVIPSEQMGEFEMSEEQAFAIYEMFLNWQEWTEKYGHYIPDDEVAEEDRLRIRGGLVKKHAMRQAINNPAWIGSKTDDAKALQTRRIVEKCLREGRKVVIFCSYTAQALKYAEIFKKLKPALYTGLAGKEREKKNAQGQPMKFKREPGVHGFKGAWVFDQNGYPIEDANGETMSALDYERLTLQNADDRKLIIATEKSGAVGTTFTAGKALIDDDLSDGVVMDIQKKDRIHRIDPQRLTHPTADYYTLRSRYPQSFLEKMKKQWVVKQEDGTFEEYPSLVAARKDPCATDDKPPKTAYEAFFAQGTYDQVQGHNLEVQRQMFRLINDGIADESVLTEDQMPFAGLENGNGH